MNEETIEAARRHMQGKPEFDVPAKRQSELTLRRMMRDAGLKDSKHKDHCVISSSGVTDSWGFSVCVTNHDGAPRIVHKRELHRLIGEVASRWWIKSAGIRKHRG